MTYYADLTIYTDSGPVLEHVKNIGWLDASHAYPRGDVEPGFIKKLKYLCRARAIKITLGKHTCELCTHIREEPACLMPVEYSKLLKVQQELRRLFQKSDNSHQIELLQQAENTLHMQIEKALQHSEEYRVAQSLEVNASGELWLEYEDRVYASPTMISHYVEVHGYRPPDEFIRAVMST